MDVFLPQEDSPQCGPNSSIISQPQTAFLEHCICIQLSVQTNFMHPGREGLVPQAKLSSADSSQCIVHPWFVMGINVPGPVKSTPVRQSVACRALGPDMIDGSTRTKEMQWIQIQDKFTLRVHQDTFVKCLWSKNQKTERPSLLFSFSQEAVWMIRLNFINLPKKQEALARNRTVFASARKAAICQRKSITSYPSADCVCASYV